MTLLEAVFVFVVPKVGNESSCPKHIPPPVVMCQDLSKHGLHANGAYYHGSKLLIIDSHICEQESYGAFVAHEMTHYVQEECGLPYSEVQAVEMQHEWFDK